MVLSLARTRTGTHRFIGVKNFKYSIISLIIITLTMLTLSRVDAHCGLATKPTRNVSRNVAVRANTGRYVFTKNNSLKLVSSCQLKIRTSTSVLSDVVGCRLCEDNEGTVDFMEASLDDTYNN